MSSGILPAPHPATIDVISSSTSYCLAPENQSILNTFPSLSANASSCSASTVLLFPQPFTTPNTYFPAISHSASSSFEFVQPDLSRSTSFAAVRRSPEVVKDYARVVAVNPGYASKNVITHKKKGSLDLKSSFSLSQRHKSRSHPTNSIQCKWAVKYSMDNGDAGKTDKESLREYEQDRNKHMKCRPSIHSHQSSHGQGVSEKDKVLSMASIKFAKDTIVGTDKVSPNEAESKGAAAHDFPFLKKSLGASSTTKPQIKEAVGSNLSRLLKMDITKKETDSCTKMPTANHQDTCGHDADVLVSSREASAISFNGNKSCNFIQEFGKNICLHSRYKDLSNLTWTLDHSDFKRGTSNYSRLYKHQTGFHTSIDNVMLEDAQSTVGEFSPAKELHSRVGECGVEETSCTSAAASKLHVSSRTPSPRYHSTRAVKIKHSRALGSPSQNYHSFLANSPSEKWAGPAYANSPPPSSLPLPNFPHQRLRTALSMEIFTLEGDSDGNINSSLRSCSLSAPSSPRRSPVFSEVPSGPESFCNQRDTAFATKDLRRILNLDSV
ncbi:hypothetical protein O6H91_10G034000 [Diphasiastrum complanatum]|nr:hypothetical protein O6H91_10G034000 [Diphasiastrum complanatum]